MTAGADPPLLCVDFETRGKADLEELGSRNYAAHATTEMVCVSFAWLDPAEPDGVGSMVLAPDRPGWSMPWPFGDVGEFEALAHNHYFDARVWERLCWPTPRRWIDTIELARRASMPLAKLEWLGANLLGTEKDMEGNRLMKSLSHLVKPSKKNGIDPATPLERLPYKLDPIPADVLERVASYCELDSRLTVRLYRDHFQPWDHVTDLEDAVLRADRVINNRGVHFDVELAAVLLGVDQRLAAKALADAGLTDPTDARAHGRFRALMASFGVDIPNAQKPTVEPLLDHPDERVATLAAARLSGNTIAGGKLRAGIARAQADSYVRDMYMYAKAHTWRWAAVNPQPQNLPGAR